jgi:hypothetical protein
MKVVFKKIGMSGYLVMVNNKVAKIVLASSGDFFPAKVKSIFAVLSSHIISSLFIPSISSSCVSDLSIHA